MAKAQVISIDNFIKDLDSRGASFGNLAGAALYDGAGILADQLRRNIENLPERSYNMKKGAPLRGVTPQQKKALLDHMGISRMRNEDGTYNIKVGFQGYDDDITKAYPKGHPVSMIARAVESGTSFLQKTPFIRPAAQKAKVPAEEAMRRKLEDGWAGVK